MSVTPWRKDKRFLLTTGTIGAVLGLVSAGKTVSEQVLTFLAVTLSAFMGQSQWGQTKRALATKTDDSGKPTPPTG